MADNLLDIKENNLINILRNYGKIAVGLSGGVDSSLLVYYGCKVLGVDNVIALTGLSDIVVDMDRKMSKAIVDFTGVTQIVLDREELNNEDFIRNDKLRCYYCKKAFFSVAKKYANEAGFEIFCDGTNASDENDYRPGEVAMRELDIKSPLREADITKSDIYALSKKYSLPTKDKTSDSCFATRIPYGETVTKESLKQVNEAEYFLHEKGFSVVRVRHHGNLAKVEVLERDIDIIMQKEVREGILKRFKEIGFIWVSVDIAGYRMGAMNDSIEKI